MYELVLLRHGQSQWNLENRFTGWVDVDLSDQGVAEARSAGDLLKQAGYDFDVVFTSALKRSIKTAWQVLDVLDRSWLPLLPHWRLNERHYGSLQGLNKDETIQKFGAEQVKLWRRSFDLLPPVLDDVSIDTYRQDRRYAGRLEGFSGLAGESLASTIDRVLPVWQESIIPAIRAKRRVLIVAHGNSLRALIKHLANLSNDEILEVNIPTAQPLVAKLDDDLRIIEQRYLSPNLVE